ncbi:MAG TPA: hypothetical protein PLR60_04685 [Syntrophorhabdaceae bacterium]|nr:hypothetical protein [Syntrophorhabdaceae bacterium]
MPNYESRESSYQPPDEGFEEHAKAMCGYGEDDSYKSRKDFFENYYFGFQYGRLECYDDFIRKNLKKDHVIFSLASGRCANELFLIQDGYKVVCSDLKIIDSYKSTKDLFSDFSFIEFDALRDDPVETYDAILVLSLIYLFDEQQLGVLLKKVNKLLKKGGYLILDSAGPPDCKLVNFYHDTYLKYESKLYVMLKSIVNRKAYGTIKKHFGFRRTDDEILESAQGSGFELVNKKNYDILSELRRSFIFNRLVRNGSPLEKIFKPLSRKAPYIRMFCFQKAS